MLNQDYKLSLLEEEELGEEEERRGSFGSVGRRRGRRGNAT